VIQPRAIHTVDEFQSILSEAVTHRQHVVASVPWSISLLGLYAFSAISLPVPASNGEDDDRQPPITIAICRDEHMLRLNMDILRHSGFNQPEVALLDANQMPHEEREVTKWLNLGRTRLLLMTPDTFTSLRFLSVLARLNIRLIVVEDAHQLMPSFNSTKGNEDYTRLSATLKRFVQLPSVCLLAGPLGNNRMVALAEMMGLPVSMLCRFPSPLASIAFKVHMPITAHQQLGQIMALVTGDGARRTSSSAHKGNSALYVSESGPVTIRVSDTKIAFKLSAMLEDALPDNIPVLQYPAAKGQPQVDPREFRQRWLTAKRGVLIDSSPPGRLLSPSPQAATHTLIYWELPNNLDLLLMDGLRRREMPDSSKRPSVEDAAKSMDEGLAESAVTNIHVFYNRERYQEAYEYLGRGLRAWGAQSVHAEAAVKQSQRFNPMMDAKQALMMVKDWCLTDECRMVTFAQRAGYPEPGPCGQCDHCEDHPTPVKGFFRKVVKQVLYS
jgi:hypothetical protein